MANRTLTTSPMTILDLTDSRRLDVYISSNLPTTQIYNVNNDTYSPDWTSTNLTLTASVYLDSMNITSNTNTAITWCKKTSAEVIICDATSSTLTISTNELSGADAIVTYVCIATYQGITSIKEIVFTRVDTGTNGTNGTSAPNIIAQYSADGTSGWTPTLNTASHKYIRFSYDDGNTWTAAIKITGEDGTGVAIKKSKDDCSAIGDGYIDEAGHLQMLVSTNPIEFQDCGEIKGPKGDQGTSSYTYIRYATNSAGSDMSTSPVGKTYIGVAITTTNTAPTVASAYTWSKYVGDNAKNIILNADAQVFKVDNANEITPSTITVTTQTLNTSVKTWSYSVDGGQTFLSTTPNGVSRSGNIVTVTGSTLVSNSIVIKASDGTYSDTLTVYKVFDGTNGNPGTPGASAPLAFLTNENITFAANAEGKITGTTFTTNVVGYNGTTKVIPTIGTPTGLPTGITYNGSTTVGDELILSFIVDNNATLGTSSNINGSITIPITSPITTGLNLNWSKVNSGHEGNGISSVTVSYGVSTSISTQPTEWQLTIPTVADGSYLWTRTITDYTDPSVADTVVYTYAKQGVKGDKGNTGSAVTVSSIQYQQGDSATAAPTGTWSNNVVSVEDGKYLWTKTTFSDGNVAYGVVKQGTDYYVHIRYRANEGETELLTEPNDYMGVYSGTSSTAPTSVSSYTWYNIKGVSGESGTDAVTFQVYSTDGYVLSKDLKEITLQTFAYKGSVAITSGATYQWSFSIGDGWTDISGATNPYLNVVHTDVADNKSYKCTMTFEGLTYTYVVTVEDKSDLRQTFTSKPLSYEEGDLWIVGDDYIPSGFAFGTILKAAQTRDTYDDADWISATKYDDIDKLAGKIEEYNQYFKLDRANGITMTAVDALNNPSPFSTTLGNDRLSFKQNNQEVAYISNNKLNITEAEMISPLTITGKYSGNTMLQAPTINLGNFSLVVESNGSLSIIANI